MTCVWGGKLFGEGSWKHISCRKGLGRRLFYHKGQNSWEGGSAAAALRGGNGSSHRGGMAGLQQLGKTQKGSFQEETTDGDGVGRVPSVQLSLLCLAFIFSICSDASLSSPASS